VACWATQHASQQCSEEVYDCASPARQQAQCSCTVRKQRIVQQYVLWQICTQAKVRVTASQSCAFSGINGGPIYSCNIVALHGSIVNTYFHQCPTGLRRPPRWPRTLAQTAAPHAGLSPHTTAPWRGLLHPSTASSPSGGAGRVRSHCLQILLCTRHTSAAQFWLSDVMVSRSEVFEMPSPAGMWCWFFTGAERSVHAFAFAMDCQ